MELSFCQSAIFVSGGTSFASTIAEAANVPSNPLAATALRRPDEVRFVLRSASARASSCREVMLDTQSPGC